MAVKFTEQELSMIIADYKSGMKPFELAKKYKRNSSSIINKLKSLGVYVDTNYRFSKEDIEFLREVYPTGDWDTIMNRFQNTPKQSIITKVSKLGIKSGSRWTDEEIEFLKTNYGKLNINELVEHYNGKYTKSAIKSKACDIGCTQDYDWTDYENSVLIDYYSILGIEEIMQKLPNRSRDAITIHAGKLGICSSYRLNTYWNDELDSVLINNHKHMTDEQIGQMIGKPKESVSERRRRLGLLRIDKDNLKYSDLNKYLRGHIQDWKNKSMISCGYKCVLTGSKDFQIHHLYNFNQIIKDLCNSGKIEYKDFSDYTQEELNCITEIFIEEHDKHPLGVCVRKDIHELFHNIYGKRNNSELQWNQFCEDYRNGLYKNTA